MKVPGGMEQGAGSRFKMGVAMVTGAWPPAEWGRLAVNWPWIAIKVKTAGYLLESIES